MSVFDGLKFRKIQSPIHNIDPRIKFVYTCVIFVITIIFGELLPLILLFFSQITLVLLAGIKREWARSMKGASFLATLILLVNLFSSLFRDNYILTSSALEYTFAMTFRFLVLVESFSIFFLTTSPDLLGLALEQTHIPYEFCFAFTTAIRFVPVLAEEAKTISDAQKARGLELEKGNFLKRIRNYIPILIPLIISAIRRSLELAEAMETRAWGATKKRTNLYLLKMSQGDFLLLIVTVGIVAIAIYVRFFLAIPSLSDILKLPFLTTKF